MSDKPFDAEACDIGGQASATNGLSDIETHIKNALCNRPLKVRLHGAFSTCVSMSEKPFDAEACDIGGQASATNGLSDIETHIRNALCNRPPTQMSEMTLFRGCLHVSESAYESPYNSVHDSLGNRIEIQLFFCHPLL
jgi:hypothetical protein